MEIFSRHSGKLLGVDEEPTVKEGDWPYTRSVLMNSPLPRLSTLGSTRRSIRLWPSTGMQPRPGRLQWSRVLRPARGERILHLSEGILHLSKGCKDSLRQAPAFAHNPALAPPDHGS
jgi:hypothetical protein